LLEIEQLGMLVQPEPDQEIGCQQPGMIADHAVDDDPIIRPEIAQMRRCTAYRG
jgi:hypothetical protein